MNPLKLPAASGLLLLFLYGVCPAEGIRFYGSLRNSLYVYNDQQTHTRIYQHVRLKAVTPNDMLSLSANLRVLTDTAEALSSNVRFRLYSLRLDAVGLLNKRLDVAAGRLFLHPGTPLGALDGVQASVTASRHVLFQVYGGIQGRFDRSFQVNPVQDYRVMGGVVEVSKYLNSKLQLLYLQKSADSRPYWHLAGVNLNSSMLPKTIIGVQAHYDLEQSRLHRMMVSAHNPWSERLQTTLEYRRQFPQVYADSYFTIFTPVAFQRLRAAAAFEVLKGYALEVQFQHVFFENDQANQAYVTFGNSFGSAGVVWENGYAGTQIGLVLDAWVEVIENLTASVAIDYSKYQVEQIYEFDHQLANAVRLDYRLNRRLAIALEYQWLTNRYKSADSRLLNHLSFVW